MRYIIPPQPALIEGKGKKGVSYYSWLLDYYKLRIDIIHILIKKETIFV